MVNSCNASTLCHLLMIQSPALIKVELWYKYPKWGVEYERYKYNLSLYSYREGIALLIINPPRECPIKLNLYCPIWFDNIFLISIANLLPARIIEL